MREKETNQKLRETVLKKIAEAKVKISAEDISVCHRQGAVKGGMQPILIKFAKLHKRDVFLTKKSK